MTRRAIRPRGLWLLSALLFLAGRPLSGEPAAALPAPAPDKPKVAAPPALRDDKSKDADAEPAKPVKSVVDPGDRSSAESGGAAAAPPAGGSRVLTPEQDKALDAVLAGGAGGAKLVALAAPPAGLVTPRNDAPASDFARPRYFAIERPAGRPLAVGRVGATCSCLLAEVLGPASFAAEREGKVVLRLRRIHAPPEGAEGFMVYAQLLQPGEDLLTVIVDPRQ